VWCVRAIVILGFARGPGERAAGGLVRARLRPEGVGTAAEGRGGLGRFGLHHRRLALVFVCVFILGFVGILVRARLRPEGVGTAAEGRGGLGRFGLHRWLLALVFVCVFILGFVSILVRAWFRPEGVGTAAEGRGGLGRFGLHRWLFGSFFVGFTIILGFARGPGERAAGGLIRA